MATRELPCAASSLTAALFDDAAAGLTEVVRTSVSVHYQTEHPALALLCLCTPSAVRLPNSVVVAAVPPPGSALIGSGSLRVGDTKWIPRRWWTPPRPRNLMPRDDVTELSAVANLVDLPGVDLPLPTYDALRPRLLVGAGPGLTPAGDDILAGALVSARAFGDDRLSLWQTTTRTALTEHATTAVSRAMLHHAIDGYATPELADFLSALCGDRSLDEPLQRLLAVGHTSGSALLYGVLHTLRTTHQMRGAA